MSSDVPSQAPASEHTGGAVPLTQPVSPAAHARIPTEYGSFTMTVFREDATGVEHVALSMGELGGDMLVRVHSECMTGDLFGSLRCDCGPQLHHALAQIGAQGRGVLVYLRQEGRGIGLINKLKAYELQDEGLDTVEANVRLGFAADLRNFQVAADILSQLGVTSVRLLTNNPRKVATLQKHGVTVIERVPVRSLAQDENKRYLSTKASKLGHHIDWL